MKKLLLAILVLVSAVAFKALDSEQHATSVAYAAVLKSHSVSSLNEKPFSTLESSQTGSITCNNCRQQNHDAPLESRLLQEGGSFQSQFHRNETQTRVAPDNYLSHIYPSHNFW